MSTYEHARRRTENWLLEAALTCLLRDGYERLTVTSIAAEANVGRGTFYAYFADVDAVLLTLSMRGFWHLQTDIHSLMAQHESPEKEIRAWQAAFERAAELKDVLLVLNHPKAVHLAQRFQDVMIEGFKQSLATNTFLYPRWMDLPVEVMATFSAGAVLAVLRKWLAGELAYSPEEMAHMVYRMLYHSAPPG